MADLRRLRDIEELVQASVFHPSPCRRLRERVLHDAVKASQRQTSWRKILGGTSAACGAVVILIAVIRVSASAPDASNLLPPKPAVAESVVPVEPLAPAQSTTVLTSSGQSLGESLYGRGSGGANAIYHVEKERQAAEPAAR